MAQKQETANAPHWISLVMEPKLDVDSVDILWNFSDGSRKAEQVKSTGNSFSPADVRKWADDLRKWEHAEGATTYKLTLAGRGRDSGSKTDYPGDIELQWLTHNADDLKILVADQLEVFLSALELPIGDREYRIGLVGRLESEILHNALTEKTLTFEALVDNLKKWIRTPAVAVPSSEDASGGRRRKSLTALIGKLATVLTVVAIALKCVVEFDRGLPWGDVVASIPWHLWLFADSILAVLGLGLWIRGSARHSRLAGYAELTLDPDNPDHLIGRKGDVADLKTRLRQWFFATTVPVIACVAAGRRWHYTSASSALFGRGRF